jgi:nucleosome binding factor SPN SPT16 subunit
VAALIALLRSRLRRLLFAICGGRLLVVVPINLVHPVAVLTGLTIPQALLAITDAMIE